jgi:hypothetical protein
MDKLNWWFKLVLEECERNEAIGSVLRIFFSENPDMTNEKPGSGTAN